MTDEVPPVPESGRGHPAEVSFNTGGPASMPPGASPWGDPDRPRYGSPPQGSRPEWGPPDPAAVSGPPWPVLVAPDGYTPPPLIWWPVGAGVAVLVAYVLFVVAGA